MSATPRLLLRMTCSALACKNPMSAGGHDRLTSSSPRIPGHEVIGDVAAVGHGEKVWKAGDRVGGAWHGGHDGS